MPTLDNIYLSEIICPVRVITPAEREGRFPYHSGVELELENVRGFDGEAPMGWTYCADPSLRNGMEFVTDSPMSGQTLINTIDRFFQYGITHISSQRASTHIHINVSDLPLGTLRSMFVISYAMEAVLYDLVSRSRKFCGYCLPLREMGSDRIVNFLYSTYTTRVIGAVSGEGNTDKYYGFNIRSASRHGTAEFRYFPACHDEDTLKDWLDYCTSVRTAAENTSLDDLGMLDSEDVLRQWIARWFPSWASRMESGLSDILRALSDVLAMSPPNTEFQPSDRVIHLTDPLRKFLISTYDEGQRAYGERLLSSMYALSLRDWNRLDQQVRASQPEGIRQDTMSRYYNYPRSPQASAVPDSPLYDSILGTELEMES